MIEVRSAYVVRAADIAEAIELWQEGRKRIWPQLGWSGRLQQMLHGHCQQSRLVWSSSWASLAKWEAAMEETGDYDDYRTWSAEMNKLRLYGGEREIFAAFGRADPLDEAPGRVEVRSGYLVRLTEVQRVKALMTYSEEVVWPLLDWGGQNQQMVHGKSSQSSLVWTSTWDTLGAWEAGMERTRGQEVFRDWYRDFLNAVDVGGTREIFRNF